MAIPKKTIDEIKSRLKRERTIREVYVEGLFDRDLYQWILNKLGFFDVKVYPISTIDVGGEILAKHNLTSGERQRVEAVARELEHNKEIHSQIIFIIDADLDYILNRACYPAPLHATFGASAELMLWKKEILTKFASMALGCSDPDSFINKLIDFSQSIAIDVFMLRAAKDILKAKWEFVDIASAIDKKGEFSFDVFCNKVGDKNAARRIMSDQLPDLLKSLRDTGRCLSPCQKMHGHDLMEVAVKKVKMEGYSNSFLGNSDDFCRVILTSLEWDHVKDDELTKIFTNKFECKL